jgi:hypothetical protein
LWGWSGLKLVLRVSENEVKARSSCSVHVQFLRLLLRVDVSASIIDDSPAVLVWPF